MCAVQARDLGVQSVALRIFNVYGIGQHPSFLVPYVVSCLDAGTRIKLRMAEAARDYVYVDDVVDALIKAAGYRGAGLEIFNVGSGQGTRVIDLVRLAEKAWGPAAGIDILEAGTGEASRLAADISKTRRLLGWSPRYDVPAGFQAMSSADPGL
jgi:nucleoside-diphosphate-sugar epimerase